MPQAFYSPDGGPSTPTVPSRLSGAPLSFTPSSPANPAQSPVQQQVAYAPIAVGPGQAVAVGPRVDPLMRSAIVAPEVQSFRGATVPSLSLVSNYVSRYVGKGFNRVPSPVAGRDVLGRWYARKRRR